MSSLYSFTPETISALKKFRISSGRAPLVQAITYLIDKDTQEISRDGNETFTSLDDLADDLPENSPRFIVLSHPIKTRDGLSKLPLVMLYWIPPTAGQRSKMMYAGAVEEFRQHAGVSRLLKIEDEEELISIPDQLL